MMSLTSSFSPFISLPNPALQLHNNTSSSSSSSSSLLHRFAPTPSIQTQKPRRTISQRQTKNSYDQETHTNKASQQTAPSSFLSFLCPLLKLFSGGDPSRERNYLIEEATSSLSSLARLPWGTRSLNANSNNLQQRPLDPPICLQLYEFEACPFCRRVREAITELDLSVEFTSLTLEAWYIDSQNSVIHTLLPPFPSPGDGVGLADRRPGWALVTRLSTCWQIYPCPKGSARHRQIVRELGGKDQFPFLFDPNTGKFLYESSDIVKYLFQQYGEGRTPSVGLLESTLFTGWVPTLLRAGRGMTLWEKSKKEPPTEKLELFSYENNPNARIVREVLCELELPYILQSVGEGSPRIKLLTEISGSKEVPFLSDPNTGTQISDYKKIVSYLIKTYSVAA